MSEGRERSFWLTLWTVYLVTAGAFSALAPIGHWRNRMFGFFLWWDNDPGGSYLSSAHELFASEGSPLFPGHPGLTLQMLLYGVEQVFFLMKAGRGEELTAFVARNLHQFGLLARTLMTLLHLVSFYALFRFSRRLFDSARAARLAVVGYATSLPVLYFLSRISVEPLMVIFFLATFLGLWNYRECLSRGAGLRAIGFAAVAAALAVSGVVTKFHFLAPLPVFGLLYVITMGPTKSGLSVGSAWKVRSWAAGTYVLASSATLFFYSLFLNWKEFFDLWRVVNEGGLVRVIRRLEGLKRILTADHLLPDASAGGIFLLCEFSFLAVALVGLVLFFRCREAERGAALWPLAFSVYTLMIFGYRSSVFGNLNGFHYLFVPMAVLAVFFGVALDALGRAFPKRARGLATLAVVLLIHHVPIWAVLDSRVKDVRAYRPLRPFQEALGRIRAGQRVGVLHRQRRFAVWVVHGLATSDFAGRRSAMLAEEFASLFVPIAVKNEQPDQLARRVRGAGVAVVLDLTEEGSEAEVYDALAWADANDPGGELLLKLPGLNKKRDPELRQRVLTAILDGTLRSRSLGDDRVRLASVTEDRWTVGDRPAVVVVQNSGKRALRVKLRIGTGAQSAGTQVPVFVDDGQEVVEHPLEGGSAPLVPLSLVPAGASRLFLVWREIPGTSAAGRPGRLGIRLNEARLRPRDRD
ncbi:MAG: hypothetical protein GY769_00515 [bacterium]|nr:hypothetical protein [bacterium]